MPQADSIPVDSTDAANPVAITAHFALSDTLTCRESDAPWSAADQATCYTGHIPYMEGIAPEPRPELPGYNSGVMAILIGLFLIITLNFRHYSTFLKTFTQNLFSVRQRANVFDEHSTTNEARVLISLILLTCVCEGILLYSMLLSEGLHTDNLTGVCAMSAVAGAYYIFQLIAYRTVGYVFTSSRRTDMWMKGFNASQSLLGITLVVPAMLSLFNPSASPALLTAGAALYIIARLIFIYKGFRIFYNNSLALIYFILYLCSLEIIPILVIYKTAIYLSSLL